MSETLTQRLLAAVLDDKPLDDDLIRDLALSCDAHGELVRLAAVLARLPGKGARAAELRLDHLLDDVALVAASEFRIPPVAADATPAVEVAGAPRGARRMRNAMRPAAAGAAIAAALIVFVLVWSRRDTTPVYHAEPPPPPIPATIPPSPSVLEPEYVKVEIRVTPGAATISVDGVSVPASFRHRRDSELHSIAVTAPGYVSKTVAVGFERSVTLDLQLARTDLVAGNVSRAPPPPRLAVKAASPEPPGRSSPRSPTPALATSVAAERAPQLAAPAQMAKPSVEVGRVVIATNVRDGAILIDDLVVGRTPLEQPLAIAAGRHRLTVTADGYASATRLIDVPAAETVRVEMPLGPVRPIDRGISIDAREGSGSVRPIDPSNPYQPGAH